MKTNSAYKQSVTGRLSCMRFSMQRLFLLLMFTAVSFAGNTQQPEAYDEISVLMNVVRIGSIEVPAVIDKEEVYLSIKDVMDFLKIKNNITADLDQVSGFIINASSTFLIDKNNNRITYQGKIFTLDTKDFIRTETGLYMKSNLFGQVFGLDCIFNFRSLSITLNTKIELPAIREMQQELMRKNISKLRGEKKADTTISRAFSWFHLGTADWSVLSTQQTKTSPVTRLNLSLGAMLAGGEANVSMNYYTDQPFSKMHQYYHWKYVDNNNAAMRQITAGKIFVQTTSSVFAPITGVHITNTPTTYRRSFGTYRLSQVTEPGWLVELYINNVLVNFVKADASGFFTFEVPMVYGNSVVKLRFYGPWGEEKTKDEFINIPFNFLPRNQFEYSFSAGVVSDEDKSKLARAAFNYGFSSRITVGGGVEYLSSLVANKQMPYLNASYRLGSGMLLAAEHTYGVRSKLTGTYRTSANLQFDVNYIKYDPNQTAIRYNYLEEKRVVMSVPLRGKKVTAFTRITLSELTQQKSKYKSAEVLMSGIYKGVNGNVTTNAEFYNDVKPNIFSNFSFIFRLPAGIRFNPQAQFNYVKHTVSMIKCDVEKGLFNQGFINFSYEKDMLSKREYFGLGFRYNLAFAQASVYARTGRHTNTVSQSLRGSLMYDDNSHKLLVDNRTNTGKGSIVIMPFLDINCNGTKESNEPKLEGLKLHVNGGRIQRNLKDTSIYITGLEAYTNYYVEIEDNSFDNIAWQIKKKTINISIEPNHCKFLEVGVQVYGEASGNVTLKNEKGTKGLGRIIINFYNKDNKLVGRTLSEPDGYFNFMGLPPGDYTAVIDKDQIQKLHLITKTIQKFSINYKMEGDVIEDLNFILAEN